MVTDLLKAENIEAKIEAYNFDGIEPFTIVIADWNTELKFFELVWDESQKHFKELPLESKIWSSSTLYDEEQKKVRRHWFKDFKSKNKLSSNSLLEFHKTAGSGNDDYGVIMDRGFVKTTSITQIEKTEDAIEMQFYNLNTSEKRAKTFNLVEAIDD